MARRSGDFALAGSAALITLDDAGKCSRARIALFGVAATPVLAEEAEKLLVGQAYAPDLSKDAARNIHGVVDPESDVHVTADYRRSVVEVLTVRAIDDAFRRAGAA